ncbi:MAG: phosphate ABC transporter permease subunit PstC [Kiritimatiellaeota bacterium]|nr:phosphate ABC transporter permease subunit PstC [Kiritimatiellota bacterium]
MRFAREQIVLTAGERRRRRAAAWAGRAVLFAVTSVAALAVLAIIFFIARDALPFFRQCGVVRFFASNAWYPTHEPPQFGALAIFCGSLIVTVTAVVIAVPPGILAAVCMSDLLPFGARQVLKPTIEMLAAIPSVVYGFFALVVLAPLMQDRLGVSSGVNALTASVILAVMALPTIVSVSEDALQASGRELREGSYAVGATRAETLVRVVIPASVSGIFSAVLLGVMRALGETMVVWMASGNAAQIPKPFFNLFAPVRTLTATIAGDMGEADQMTGSAHYHVLFAMGLSLLFFSFLCNVAGEWIVARQRRRMRGG